MADADVRLAVTHAPYLRVLDQYAADGYDAASRTLRFTRPGPSQDYTVTLSGNRLDGSIVVLVKVDHIHPRRTLGDRISCLHHFGLGLRTRAAAA